MFAPNQTEAKLDAEIISALETLEAISDKSSDRYGALVDRIAKLHKLKTEEHSAQIEDIVTMDKIETDPWFKRISPDTALVVAANVFGILWLARYESENVIKARSALGFVMKPR